MASQLIAETVCSQLRCEYAAICRSVEYLLVKLVDVMMVVGYQLYVVEDVETVFLMLLH